MENESEELLQFEIHPNPLAGEAIGEIHHR
jgi:hypothetical protein